jgi:hypothetical protein
MTDCRIQIFVVFHHTLFDECYQHIPDDVLHKYFTFFAVNDQIVKTYTPNKYKVVNEWELPMYDPLFYTFLHFKRRLFIYELYE